MRSGCAFNRKHNANARLAPQESPGNNNIFGLDTLYQKRLIDIKMASIASQGRDVQAQADNPYEPLAFACAQQYQS